ncbi:hypothetical protein PHMEG_00020384 [Phytophthora megakarya]|uniref:Ankyrin repeat-containing domain n=1 Tax=Phytophthora megakarya TaxID=4795 RepID=A0A225VP15_9STRA|nr:hypothetical protein PHMEG_00020384 [Phytophthora megakarya]
MTEAAVVAAAEGRLDVLQWLFQNHHTRVHWGGAEWCESVSGGHTDVMEWLRRHVTVHSEVAPQLMLDAARAGDLLLVQALHKNYELPLSNALIEAQKRGRWGVVKWILKSGGVEDPKVDMDIIAADSDIDFLQWVYTQGFGRPTSRALEFAAFNGRLNILEWLHVGPAKLELSCSVLKEAARGGKLDVVKWLLDRHCPSTSAAMEAAAENGYLQIMQLLYANSEAVCTSRALDRAASNGHLEVVKWLDAIDRSLYCPAAMNRAAEFGHLDIVKWLHANRAEGCSTEALDCACHFGHLEVVRWLKANRTEGFGKLAMDLAASCGHLDVVKWLQQDLHNSCSTWAMDSAARQGHLHVVKWLHSNRTEGSTAEAMSDAAANGHLDIVRWLQHHRSEGCYATALNRSISGGHLNVAMFLHCERGLKCSIRGTVTLRLRLEMVQWLLTTCSDELDQGVKFQVARRDWHFNDWMRSQGMQIVNQDDSNVVWKWSSRNVVNRNGT